MAPVLFLGAGLRYAAVVCVGIAGVSVFIEGAFAIESVTIPGEIQTIVTRYCVDCHGPETAEADLRFDGLEKLELDGRLELLNAAHEQIHFGRMPPADSEQPTPVERALLNNWVASELRAHNACKLDDKLRRPESGNLVDHDQLFSGKYADLPGFTYDRRWLISEYIFDARFNRILNHSPSLMIDGVRHAVIGNNNRQVNLTNPFLLPTNSGVRYYAEETLNGGHLLTMMTNAKEASQFLLNHAEKDLRRFPAVSAIMASEWKNKKTLATRKLFLYEFIEHVLQEMYGAGHEALLPPFVRAEVGAAIESSENETKKAPFHAAQPGSEDLIVIYRTMSRHQRSGDDDEQLIEKCEREWFYYGLHERTIQGWVTFLRNYMPEWRNQIIQHKFAERHAPPIYRPLEAVEMQAIEDAVRKCRKPGDRYDAVIAKCVATWEAEFEQARVAAGPPDAGEAETLIRQSYEKILERAPSPEEAKYYSALAGKFFQVMDRRSAIEKLLQTLMLRSDFVYRNEFGEGSADAHGRRMMSPRDASYALAYALTDSSPDQELAEAARTGRLNTREDYRREVLRMLKNRNQYYIVDEAVERLQQASSFTNMPIRELRFFREFFGYPQLLSIFKDNKRFGGDYDGTKGRLVSEADQLVERILESDRQVFEQLLTTRDFYVYHSGDNAAMAAYSARIRRIYDYFKDKDWQNFEIEDLKKHKAFLDEVKMRGVNTEKLGAESGRQDSLRSFKTSMASYTLRFEKGQTSAAPYDAFPAHGTSDASTRSGFQLRGPEVAKFFNLALDNWNYPTTQPAPVAHRKGMLTHPAWLIAHAQNTETDPVRRGKWIREKLLAGTVPDVPITVDAVVPEDPHKTLRQRLELKTAESYCARCHERMNPLGLAFEMYDDFGRYRTDERLEYPENLVSKGPEKAPPHVDLRDVYKTLPVDARGHLDGTGNAQLDGDVTDALDLIDRLVKSDRVRQSIIRHAFRFFLGRNEILSDSKTLIDADRAYVESNGSFDAVVVSLLTSDSFIYRKPLETDYVPQ